MPCRPDDAERLEDEHVVKSRQKQVARKTDGEGAIAFRGQPAGKQHVDGESGAGCQCLVSQRERRLRAPGANRPAGDERKRRWRDRSLRPRLRLDNRVHSRQRPSARRIAPIVWIMISRSSLRHHLSMYWRSNLMLVSKEGSWRAVTCQSPVMPGFTSRRRRWSRSYWM